MEGRRETCELCWSGKFNQLLFSRQPRRTCQQEYQLNIPNFNYHKEQIKNMKQLYLFNVYFSTVIDIYKRNQAYFGEGNNVSYTRGTVPVCWDT